MSIFKNRNEIVKGISTPEEGYEVLGMFVIKSAADEYRRALMEGDELKIQTNEHFFRGPRFRVFARNIDPEYIIQKIREEVNGRKGKA